MMHLIALILFLQGIPVLPNQGGTVTGILKSADGMPVAGVRVTAVARPESVADVARAAKMASLAETDQTGRYRLENIPPGHYHIAAGRIDLQTYYPGVLEISGAADILIKAGDSVTGIDFVLKDSSSGRAQNGFSISSVSAVSIPVTVTVEDGGRVPVFSPRGFARLVLTRIGDNARSMTSLDQHGIGIIESGSSPTASEYQVSVEGLPDGFAVRSITFGAENLMTSTLKIPAATFRALQQSQSIVQLLSAGLTAAPPAISSTSSTASSLNTISLVLTAVPVPTPTAPGVRVSGKSIPSGTRSIYISGNAGTLYADGTFEFSGVPAGRHVVITRDGPRTSRPMAAVVIIGNRDVDGVPLEEIMVLPPDFDTPAAPVADTRAPGTVIRFAMLRGRVFEESTRVGIPEGIVYIGGLERTSFRLKSDGTFEVPHLLPGSYKLEIQVFGYLNISQTVIVAEDDINLELPTSLVVKPVE